MPDHRVNRLVQAQHLRETFAKTRQVRGAAAGITVRRRIDADHREAGRVQRRDEIAEARSARSPAVQQHDRRARRDPISTSVNSSAPNVSVDFFACATMPRVGRVDRAPRRRHEHPQREQPGEPRAQAPGPARRTAAGAAARRATRRARPGRARVCGALPSGGHVGRGEFGRHARGAAVVEIEANVLRRGARQRAAVGRVAQLEAAGHAQLADRTPRSRWRPRRDRRASPHAGIRSRCATPPCRAATACRRRSAGRARPSATTPRDRATGGTRRCSRVHRRRCHRGCTSDGDEVRCGEIPGVEHALKSMKVADKIQGLARGARVPSRKTHEGLHETHLREASPLCSSPQTAGAGVYVEMVDHNIATEHDQARRRKCTWRAVRAASSTTAGMRPSSRATRCTSSTRPTRVTSCSTRPRWTNSPRK